MSDDLIVKHCSPTLAGLKTGSMFCCSFESDAELTCTLYRLNKILGPLGLRAIPLRHTPGGGRAMIYIYRPAMLGKDLKAAKATSILSGFGYDTGNVNVCIARLIKRLQGSCPKDFPHEIGLFLGYPPEDVEGFICNHAGGCKICGTWKVYGDVESARRRFDSFRSCTRAFTEKYRQAGSFEKFINAQCGHALG